MKRWWLNSILHLSSLIQKKKLAMLASGVLKNFLLFGEVFCLEIIISVLSLPSYFFITPDQDFSGNQKQIKMYHLRQKITLATLAFFLLTIILRFTFGFFDFLSYKEKTKAALTVSLTISGSYIGNGNDDRAITGVGFQPDVVIIKGNTTQSAVIKTSQMSGDATKPAAASAITTNLVQSLDSDGFTIGDDAKVNGDTVSYYWTAFKSAPSALKVGTYMGNGGSSQAITGAGFSPEFVMVIPADSTVPMARFNVLSQAFSVLGGTAASRVNSLDADGFTAGSVLNTNNVSYYYIAWNEVAGRMKDYVYPGNGVDNRDNPNSTGVIPGFLPEYVMIFSASDPAVSHPAALSGDSTLSFGAIANLTNSIQQLLSNGFQVGTDRTVNQNGAAYYWVAFVRSAPPIFNQAAYRFATNADSTDVGPALAANNTDVTLSSVGQDFRLRMLMNVSNDQLVQNGETFKLQYVEKGAGSCVSPSGTNPATYTDVTNATLMAYKDNSTPSDGSNLTLNGASDPTDGSNPIVAQTYVEANNIINSTAAIPSGQNGLWDFSLYDNGAPAGSSYCFRIVRSDNTALNTYTVYPQITTTTPDITAPTITGITSSTPNGVYKAGDIVSIQVELTEIVSVTGTPHIIMETGANDAIVMYTGGSGTNTLTFDYTVGGGENSTDLDYMDTTALSLNGGTIKDVAGNDAVLTLASPGASGSLSANKNITIDTTAPIVLDVTSSDANAMYGIGASLSIQIQLSENIVVTGTPRLTLETGASDAIANYTGGSGTDILTFTYVVGADENSLDLDYTDVNALSLNSGTLKDTVGNNTTLTLLNPGATGSLGANKNIVINTDVTPPTIINVTSSKENGIYGLTEVIPVQVQLSESVNVVGVPALTIESGTNDTFALYVSGSGTDTLTFNYTVGAAQSSSDLDYIDTTALVLSGGTIRDIAENNAVLTLASPGTAGSLSANKDIVIDTTPPDITAPTVMDVHSPLANGTYTVDQVIPLHVQMSENVDVTGTPQLTLETGPTDVVVNYASGSGTSTLIFNYTVEAGQNSIDLDYSGTTALSSNGGTIRDAAENDAVLTLPNPTDSGSLGANKNIIIDTIGPTVLNVTSPQLDGDYETDETISVRVQFNEVVQVIGIPKLTLETGWPDAVVDYTSGSGSDTLTFEYTIVFGNTSEDLDYSNTTALSLNGGTIKDSAGNNAVLTLPSPGTSGSLGNNKNIVVYTVGGFVDNVTSATENGTYTVGQNIVIQVIFNRPVDVTGTPQLILETGASDAIANYTGGSGTNILNFSYTIASGQSSIDLDYVDTAALILNGGTIKEDEYYTNAVLTLPSPGASGSLGINKDIVIDTIVPASVSTLNTSREGGAGGAGAGAGAGAAGAGGASIPQNIDTPEIIPKSPVPPLQSPAQNPPASGDFFDDIAGHSSREAINKLKLLCDVSGYASQSGKPSFRPDANVSRAELVVMLLKCEKKSFKFSVSRLPFSDVPVKHWAVSFLREAIRLGLVSTENKEFRPNDPTTFAEALKMVLSLKFNASLINSTVQNSQCKDVQSNAWYAKYFYFALTKKIIAPAKSGICQPFKNITRAQVAELVIKSQ